MPSCDNSHIGHQLGGQLWSRISQKVCIYDHIDQGSGKSVCSPLLSTSNMFLSLRQSLLIQSLIHHAIWLYTMHCARWERPTVCCCNSTSGCLRDMIAYSIGTPAQINLGHCNHNRVTGSPSPVSYRLQNSFSLTYSAHDRTVMLQLNQERVSIFCPCRVRFLEQWKLCHYQHLFVSNKKLVKPIQDSPMGLRGWDTDWDWLVGVSSAVLSSAAKLCKT